ncbi:MAG: protein kinase [Phycisphaerales bacterium]
MVGPPGDELKGGDSPRSVNSDNGDVALTEDARPVRVRDEDRPERIGPYRILDVLGEGGMGTVFLAEQFEPVRRRVALKVIRRGMDTKSVIARFNAERQALAMMDHPNVAQVFEAGETSDGRPFFAMEHVPGVPLTDYCDRMRLSTNDRLELLIEVCHAVHHAHQKGVIHRDIKPTNVLVMTRDGRPHPKVIDFGVAKATNQRLTEQTIYTEHGQLIGTPEYMSPEQAEMTGLNVDIRTDVYSLGVLLYELLTGKLPFDSDELRRRGIVEIQRIIREEDPPKPSTRLSSLNAQESGRLAKQRHTNSGELLKLLRGDLDWITMRALEKDRTRRYGSAASLSEDLRRHLNNEPVAAGPPTAIYRMRKFVRRHRALVVSAIIVSSALLVTSIVSSAAAVTAARAELRARNSESAEREARFQAEAIADEAMRSAYLGRLAAASAALQAGDLAGARRHLLKAPTTLRNWEWHYLWGLLDDSLAVNESAEAAVNSVAITTDYSLMATGDSTGEIVLWNPRRRTALHRFTVNSDVYSIAIDPTGEYLAAAALDGILRIWRLPYTNPAPDFTWNEGSGYLQDVRFSPDGTRVVSSSRDGKAIVRNLPAGTIARTIEEPDTEILEARFIGDADHLITVADNGRVAVWDLTTGAEEQVYEMSEARPACVAISPDSTVLWLGGRDGRIHRIDRQSKDTPMTSAKLNATIKAIELSPDGRLVATAGSSDRCVRLWDPATLEEMAMFRGHTDFVEDVRFYDANGRLGVISVSMDKTVRWWPSESVEKRRRLPNEGMLSRVFIDSTNNQIWVSGRGRSEAGVVTRWNASTGAQSASYETGSPFVSDMLLNPAGDRLLTCAHDGIIRVWNPVTNTPIETIEAPERMAILALAHHPRDNLFAACGANGVVYLFSNDGGDPIQISAHSNEIHRAQFSRDGGRLLTVGKDSFARLWNVATKSVVWEQRTDSHFYLDAVFHPIRDWVALADANGKIELRQTSDGQLVIPALEGHQSPVSSLSFSPDGARLASGAWNGSVMIWDAGTGEEIVTLHEHARPVTAVAFSGDGALLISSGQGEPTVVRRGKARENEP